MEQTIVILILYCVLLGLQLLAKYMWNLLGFTENLDLK